MISMPPFAWADSNYPAVKKTYMKTTQIVAMWTSGLGSLVPAQAFDILGMRSDPNAIQTATEASKLPVGTPLIFMCDRCKGSEVMMVDEKKTILTWFNSLKTKKCPGSCGGLVNYVSRATPAGREFPDTYNTCSRCRRPTISWSAPSRHELSPPRLAVAVLSGTAWDPMYQVNV